MDTIIEKALYLGTAVEGTDPHFRHRSRALRSFLRVWHLLHLWQERRAQRHALKSLEPRMIEDIGLSQEQVREEAAKPFWQA